MQTHSLLKLSPLAAALSLFSSPCGAVIYDPATDFSLASNPAGVWSYGFSTTLGGAMTLDTEGFVDGTGLYVWRKAGSAANGPLFAYNPTANPIIITGTTANTVWAPHQLSLHPGSVNMEYCVLRLTIPLTSQYAVSGAFSSVDQYFGATTDVHILRNGASVYNGMVQGKTSVSALNQSLLLQAGDSLDFVVGVDGYAGGWDSTGLAASVVPIPEPSGINLLLLGVPLALGLFHRPSTHRAGVQAG